MTPFYFALLLTELDFHGTQNIPFNAKGTSQCYMSFRAANEYLMKANKRLLDGNFGVFSMKGWAHALE